MYYVVQSVICHLKKTVETLSFVVCGSGGLEIYLNAVVEPNEDRELIYAMGLAGYFASQEVVQYGQVR